MGGSQTVQHFTCGRVSRSFTSTLKQLLKKSKIIRINNHLYPSPQSLSAVRTHCLRSSSPEKLHSFFLSPGCGYLHWKHQPFFRTLSEIQKWHSPVCNVGMRCLYSVSDLLIKLLDLLPHHLEIRSGLWRLHFDHLKVLLESLPRACFDVMLNLLLHLVQKMNIHYCRLQNVTCGIIPLAEVTSLVFGDCDIPVSHLAHGTCYKHPCPDAPLVWGCFQEAPFWQFQDLMASCWGPPSSPIYFCISSEGFHV